ncbi:MAG TPA: translational GTPase TypA [Patescibacteria group bacterium]|nr:translational GTPase TypA [Patescibacteria group bacterium]
MNIRNIAIIAHVDHGKTTLVDGMLKQTHTFRDNQAEMTATTILDSNTLEREKGITILAKNTSVMYHDTKINIIDTPGHADFSGEVERVINMADGALLIVDAAEGVLPQTQFVLEKALEQNIPVIVVVNKIDRKDARPKEVLREIEELFLHIAHHEGHLDFPVLFAVGREEKSWESLPSDPNAKADLEPLFEAILRHVPPPDGEPNAPFKMLVTTLDFDSHKGKFAIGKISQGTVKKGDNLLILDENTPKGTFRVEEVFTSIGLDRISSALGKTGDIIAITGSSDMSIGQTLTNPADPTGFPKIQIEEPTLKVLVGPNTSPFAGRESKFGTPTQLADRLTREIQTNVGLKIEPSPTSNGFLVSGRGELHIAVLLETMRREGFECQVGKPEVIVKNVDGVTYEPYEELTIELDSALIGIITEEMGKRHGEMIDSHTNDRGTTKMVYKISTRNLLGFRGDILTKTRGSGIIATRIIGYFPMTPKKAKARNGVLVAVESGKSTGYALTTVQERGKALIGPGIPVYEGMIIGINNRSEDIDINVVKSKRLTNIHSANADIAIQLDPPVEMTLEQALDFIEDDELLEITPLALRLRKIHLSKVNRVRAARA